MMVYKLIFVFVVLAVECNAIAKSDMFLWGSSFLGAGEGNTANVENIFNNASLLDSFEPLTIPNVFPSFRIFGTDLGRNAFVSNLFFSLSFSVIFEIYLNFSSRFTIEENSVRGI